MAANDPSNYGWISAINPRLVQEWLWHQLSPHRVSFTVVGGSNPALLPSMLQPFLSYRWLDAPLMQRLRVMDPYAPPYPTSFQWAFFPSEPGSWLRCELQHASYFHNKSEVLVGFVLPPWSSTLPLTLPVVRRLLSWTMFTSIRAKGGYSYYASVATTVPLCHADSQGLMLANWQPGDYPNWIQDTVISSFSDAVRTMQESYPQIEW